LLIPRPLLQEESWRDLEREERRRLEEEDKSLTCGTHELTVIFCKIDSDLELDIEADLKEIESCQNILCIGWTTCRLETESEFD
jgi:exosome complex RNA-binding protein Rrp42 (RNase PH superfamily)